MGERSPERRTVHRLLAAVALVFVLPVSALPKVLLVINAVVLVVTLDPDDGEAGSAAPRRFWNGLGASLQDNVRTAAVCVGAALLAVVTVELLLNAAGEVVDARRWADVEALALAASAVLGALLDPTVLVWMLLALVTLSVAFPCGDVAARYLAWRDRAARALIAAMTVCSFTFLTSVAAEGYSDTWHATYRERLVDGHRALHRAVDESVALAFLSISLSSFEERDGDSDLFGLIDVASRRAEPERSLERAAAHTAHAVRPPPDGSSAAWAWRGGREAAANEVLDASQRARVQAAQRDVEESLSTVEAVKGALGEAVKLAIASLVPEDMRPLATHYTAALAQSLADSLVDVAYPEALRTVAAVSLWARLNLYAPNVDGPLFPPGPEIVVARAVPEDRGRPSPEAMTRLLDALAEAEAEAVRDAARAKRRAQARAQEQIEALEQLKLPSPDARYERIFGERPGAGRLDRTARITRTGSTPPRPRAPPR